MRRWLITGDTSSGRDALDSARMPQALASLARELLEMEATGDRARVEKWFQKYAAMPAELVTALARVSDVPVDIDLLFPGADSLTAAEHPRLRAKHIEENACARHLPGNSDGRLGELRVFSPSVQTFSS